jgi:hypothetical protein
MWCIAELDQAYIQKMEDVLAICQCRDKTPAILPVLPIRAAVSLGGDAVGTLQ